MGMEQNNHDSEEGTLEIGMGRFFNGLSLLSFVNFWSFIVRNWI